MTNTSFMARFGARLFDYAGNDRHDLPVWAVARAAIVVAPRHMERVDAWRQRLNTLFAPDAPPTEQYKRISPCAREQGAPTASVNARQAACPQDTAPAGVLLRSTGQPAGPGSVVIWDSFGELRRLYGRANAVFVGGSLAPLGGQNFLEAAVLGHVPVVGPHLKNFAWIGEDFFEQGLARRVPDAAALAPALLEALRSPLSREEKAAQTAAYLAPRRGGGHMAAALVRDMLGR